MKSSSHPYEEEDSRTVVVWIDVSANEKTVVTLIYEINKVVDFIY